MRKVDLTGKRFGRLVVLGLYKREKGKTFWRCKCDCGKEKIVRHSNITSGETKSCGCLSTETLYNRITKHGLSKTRIYDRYCSIKSRCYDKNNIEYQIYGGRGIKMCDEWKNDFVSFYNWSINNGWDEKKSRKDCSIDRIDPNGDYSPNNCRWVSMKKQNNNRRNNHIIIVDNEKGTLSYWLEKCNMPRATFFERLKRGMSDLEALLTPINLSKSRRR